MAKKKVNYLTLQAEYQNYLDIHVLRYLPLRINWYTMESFILLLTRFTAEHLKYFLSMFAGTMRTLVVGERLSIFPIAKSTFLHFLDLTDVHVEESE